MTGKMRTYLYGAIVLVVMILIDFVLWRVFFAPTKGVFKLFTPMYGFSLVAMYFFIVYAMVDLFGLDNTDGSVITGGLWRLALSVGLLFIVYYGLFWNVIGNYGVTYFSPHAIVETGGTGAEMYNARENASLAILYVVACLLWVSIIWNSGLGDHPWDECSSRRVIGISKLFGVTTVSVLVYAVFYHPNITALFVPKQVYAGVIPWWSDVAMTSSSFYHLGWMFSGLLVVMVMTDVFDGKPFHRIGSKENGNLMRGLVMLVVAVAGGFILLVIEEAVMNAFWFEPFTGGNYTDDPRFRHLHVAEIAGFGMLAIMIVRVYFRNIVRDNPGIAAYVGRMAAVIAGTVILYMFYYSEVVGPFFVDRVPGIGSVDDTSLCWTLMSMVLIMVHERFFNVAPLGRK